MLIKYLGWVLFLSSLRVNKDLSEGGLLVNMT